jgi:predicted negative regulator of RcsB-dependent stress response
MIPPIQGGSMRFGSFLVPALVAVGCLGLLATPAIAAPKAPQKATGKDMDFEPEAANGAAASTTLTRAIKLYDKKDFFSASIELQKVLDKESGDDARNVQRAEFFMGKTLYQMGFYAASLTYFDKIVQAGDQHTYHGAALKWLAALSRVLPETSGILEKIGTYDASALDDPSLASVKDELMFLLGRHFYRRGNSDDFEKAIALFQKVDRNSEFFIKAKFFEGVTYVRMYQGHPAVDAFKEILVIAAEHAEHAAPYKREDIADYNELAQLQMARVFYSTQQFDLSIKYFERLDQNSEDWAESLFEASWAYFMKTLNSKALGNIHTLNAPYFEDEFFPESNLLKGVIYFKYCLYDQAQEAIADFNDKYGPLANNLKTLLGKYDDNNEFYEYVKKVKSGKAGLDPTTQRLVTSVLTDKTLLKTFSWVDELNHELDMLQKSDKAWQTTKVAADVLAALTVEQSVASTNAGKVARDRIDRLQRELGALSRDGLKIKFEILEAKGNKLSADAIDKAGVGGRVDASTHREEPIVVDDEHFQWKFNGEYWKDELGYYRFRIRSVCPRNAPVAQ